MARWGDRGKFEGVDDDSIGEPGYRDYPGLQTPLRFVFRIKVPVTPPGQRLSGQSKT